MAEPANLYDNDIPIHTAAAYLFTTAERARDMRQPPVYVLGHASGGRVAGDPTRLQAARRHRQPGGDPGVGGDHGPAAV